MSHMFFMTTSYCHLILMSIRRYFAISKPLRTRVTTSRKRYFVCLFLAWIPGFLPVSLQFYTYIDIEFSRPFPGVSWVKFTEVFILVFSYFLPYLVTVLATVATLVKFVSNNRKQRQLSLGRRGTVVTDRTRQKREVKLTIMVLLIVLGYTVTCIPFTYQLSYFAVNNLRANFFEVILLVPGTITTVNGIVDVLVYSVVDNMFRTHTKTVLASITRSRSRVQISVPT